MPRLSRISGVNTPALEVLSALKNGRIFDALRQSLFLAAQFGPKIPEANAMAAICMEKMGDAKGAMTYWRDLARSFPWQMGWFGKAMAAAINMDEVGESEYFHEFLTYLRSCFLEPPPMAILSKLAQRGLGINGSCGIHDNTLHGWICLPPNARPVLRTSLTDRQVSISITRVEAGMAGIVYKLHAPLPQMPQNFDLEIRDHTGAHIQGSPLVCSSVQSAIPVGKMPSAKIQVTVLVPVYDDRVATLGCLGSVLASLRKNRTPSRVLVVWDHGPDARLYDALRRLAERGRIQLVSTPHNYGFLAAVNYALKHIPCGDVILLNSDTIVHGDWIDRLKKAGELPDAATVTAMGTEAELVSWPMPGNSCKVTSLRATAVLDKACASLPASDAIQKITVGVGFCMLVTRRALDRLHGFDGMAVFRGYGEEAEFCLRAKDAGLHNYAALNVFVAHLQGRSFGKSKIALAAQNNKAIKKRNPYYEREYELFMAADSPRLAREKISASLCLELLGGHVHVRQWHSGLGPWWSRRKTRELAGTWLYILPCAGAQALAVLKIGGQTAMEDMRFSLPDQERDLTAILRRFDSASAENPGSEVMIWARRLLSHLTLAVADALPPMNNIINDEGLACRCSLALPPASMGGIRRLLDYASRHGDEAIYLWEMTKYLRNMPVPENMYELIDGQRPDHLFFEKVIFCDACPDLDHWRQWLKANGCGSLPIYRLDRA